MSLAVFFAIFRTEWQRQLMYRSTIIAYRIGHLLEIAIPLTVWTAIYANTSTVYGYTYQEMMTYIIVGWLFSFINSNYGFESVIARDIHQGTLANFLTKPISYLRYMVALSLGRITLPLIGGAIIQGVLILTLYKFIVFPTSIWSILVVAGMVGIGYFIRLFLAILIGLLALWFTEVAGIHYCFHIISALLSGGFFPITLFPPIMYHIVRVLPFAYTHFFPVQLYLSKMTLRDGLLGLGIEILWLLALAVLVRVLWRVGLKKFESVGI